MTAPSEWGPLYDTALALLTATVQAYAADGVELPDRRYITPGAQPAYDCPQLTVSVTAVRNGIPGSEQNRPVANCPPMRYATYRLELVRGTPTLDDRGDPPSPDELTASAAVVLRDVDMLDRHVRAAARGFAGPGVPVFVGATTPLGPDGGLSGVLVDVDVPIAFGVPTPL